MTLLFSFPVVKELAQVQDAILHFSKLSDEPLNKIADISMSLGGKHLRATLLLLAGKLYGPVSQKIIDMAALAELIHTATLIHDDVFDNAMMRRGQPSINNKFGSEIALLYGDYLLCQVFIQIYEIQPIFVKYFSETLRDMCIGEILETMHHFDGNMSEELYFSIIEKKTASLFKTCCSLGPIMQGASMKAVKALSSFGLEAGMAFQIVDDILDVTGNSSVLGKPAVNDINNGKITLPIIYSLNNATMEERSLILNSFSCQTISPEARKQFSYLIERYSGIERARETAKKHLERAKRILADLPKNEIRCAMEEVAELFVQRMF